jgi:drug/metabolite transporter (DMT)-like permease
MTSILLCDFHLPIYSVRLSFWETPHLKRESLSFEAVVLSLIGAAASGLAYMTLKSASRTVKPEWIALFFSGTALVGATPLMLPHFIFPHKSMWGFLVLVGAGASLYQYFVTKAYQSGEAVRVAPFGLLVPLFCSMGEWMFFHETLEGRQYGGGFLMLLGIGYFAYLSKRPSPSSTFLESINGINRMKLLCGRRY